MSAQLCSPGARTEQPTFDSSEGLPPDIPPGTARCGDSTNDLLSRRKRLARDVPSSADEGVEQTKGSEGVKDQHAEAGTTGEASLALECPPLPFKRCAKLRWRVYIPCGLWFARAWAVWRDYRAVPFVLTSAGVSSGTRWGHLCLPGWLPQRIGARRTTTVTASISRRCSMPLNRSSGVGLAFFFRNIGTSSTTHRCCSFATYVLFARVIGRHSDKDTTSRTKQNRCLRRQSRRTTFKCFAQFDNGWGRLRSMPGRSLRESVEKEASP